MNKTLLKELRNMAKDLPISYDEVFEVERIKGKDLIKRGITEVQGKVIPDDDKIITIRHTRLRLVNHYRRLKKYYAEFGAEDFLFKYFDWLNVHQENLLTKHPELREKAY